MLYIFISVASLLFGFFFLFKQKTEYDMRISDWSADVCSSDLGGLTEGLITRGCCPSTIACGDGPPPHRFATGRIGNVPSPPQDRHSSPGHSGTKLTVSPSFGRGIGSTCHSGA